MSEVLVRIRDKAGQDPLLAGMSLGRGDVVAVCPDGWSWSQNELTNRDWRIVSLPLVSVAQVDSFIQPRVRVQPDGSHTVIRKRDGNIDLANATLPAAFKTWLQDDARAQPISAINLTGAQLLNLYKSYAANLVVF